MKLLVLLLAVSAVFGSGDETNITTAKSVAITTEPEVEEKDPDSETTTVTPEDDEEATQTTSKAAGKDDSVESGTTTKSKAEIKATTLNTADSKLDATTPSNGTGKGERKGPITCPEDLFGPGCNLACGFC